MAWADLWFEAKGNNGVTSINVDYDIALVKDEEPMVSQ